MDLSEEAGKPNRRVSHATNKGVQSRQRIVDAAAGILGERGPSGLSIANVAKAAGVSKGSLYYYFADLDQIVEAVVERELGRLVSSIEHAALGAHSAKEALSLMTDAFVSELDEGVVLLRYLLGQVYCAGEGDQDERGRSTVRSRILDLIATQLERGKIEGSVRADVDPDTAGAAIFGVFLSLAAYGPRREGGAVDGRLLRESILSFVTSGVSVPET